MIAPLDFDRLGRLDDIRFGFQNFINPVDGGHALLDLGVEAGQPFQRRVHQHDRSQKRKKGPGRIDAVHDLGAAEPDNQGDTQARE